MARRVLRDFLTAYPDLLVETRVEEKTVQAMDRIVARLERGEVGSVGALVRDERGFVLLQRHDPATGWPPEAWAVPGGGVLAEETFEDAVVRETLEETGLKVVVERPLVLVRQKFFSGKRHADYPFVLFAARPKNPRGTPNPRAGEVVEAKWFHRFPSTTFDRALLMRFL